MSLEEKKADYLDKGAAGNCQLTKKQEEILSNAWEFGVEAMIPLINRWMMQNYDTTFDYAWAACEYVTALGASKENNAPEK